MKESSGCSANGLDNTKDVFADSQGIRDTVDADIIGDTNKQADRETDKQTERETYTYAHIDGLQIKLSTSFIYGRILEIDAKRRRNEHCSGCNAHASVCSHVG